MFTFSATTNFPGISHTEHISNSSIHRVVWFAQSPYFIVEFKPALGWLFREYLREYSHWAFGDLDVLFGNLRNGWLEPDELKDFDIITFR